MTDRSAAAPTVFCAQCGRRIESNAPYCPNCGAENAVLGVRRDEAVSNRKYGVAIALCGIFGIVGVHHFYLGNHLHGLFDFGLFVGMIACFVTAGSGSGEPGLFVTVGIVFLLTDVIHTTVVFYLLIVGRQRDGQGRLVTYEKHAA